MLVRQTSITAEVLSGDEIRDSINLDHCVCACVYSVVCVGVGVCVDDIRGTHSYQLSLITAPSVTHIKINLCSVDDRRQLNRNSFHM